MDEFDKALEYLDAPSTPTATPSATTETSSATAGTPSISEVNNHNVDVIIGALKDLHVDVSKGEEGVLKGTMKGWKRASAIPGMTARATTSAPTISTSRSTEANKKDEARKAASNRKREARRAALAAYEKERFKEQPNKQPEVKKKRSFFPSRRKSAPAGSLNAPVSPLSVPASSSELDLKKIDELEWRSFNTWVVDLTSDLKNFSISFNQIVSKKRKKFEVEPLKNDKTYNPYNPVYVIHYFKDFWDKIKGFYGAEKVKLEGSNEVDEFIKTIDKENWVDDGWDNPKFSTNPKAKEPELNKNNKVIKAFEGWLKIIKKNVTNLQDKIGKENIENNKKYKVIDDESVNELWQDYGRYIEEYNKFVKDQNRLVYEQKEGKILSTLIDANDRKSREIRERIVNPIFSNGEFENLTPADLLKNFSDKKAPECKERGQLVGKYERLKAILYDAEMIEGAGGLCKCLYDFHKEVSSGSKISPMAKVLNQRTKNIRECFVDPKRAVELAGSFKDLLDAINDSIDKLWGVYNNVRGALSGDASIIGKDYDFIFGRDENNCWRVYQNKDGTEKEIGYIAEVYYKVVKKDGKQEKNAYLRDLNGKVTLYDKAFIYGRLSSYLRGSMGYLSFENNFTPNGEIKCYYTDEEGKENSVTFNANGMAIEINRQGEEMEVNKDSNAFKQLKQAFEGNQSSSIPPQSDLDINNNEKNEGGINMAETETTKIEAAKRQLMDFVEKYNEFLSSRSEFAEKHMELKDDFNKGILKDYRVDWWDKFEKYELGDLSNIDFVKAQWGMVLADLIRKYLPTGELDSTMKELSNIGSEFSNAKSNEEKLNILGEYHTEARKLLKKVEDKLIDLNNFSERIKNRGSAFEGLTDRLEKDKPKGKHKAFKSIKKFLFGHKESGSANSGANNSRSIDHDLTTEFVNSKILGLTTCVSEYRKFLEEYNKFFNSNTNAATIVDSNLNKGIFNIDKWKEGSTFEVEGVKENITNIYQVLDEYRRIAKELINYFNKKGDAGLKHSSKKYVEFIKESDNINFPDGKPFDAGDNSQQQFVSDAVKSLEYMIIDLNGELDKLEKAAANGGEKTDEDVGETNVNEDAEQKEEPKATETVDNSKLKEENKLLASGLGVQAHGQLIKAVEEYDKFVDNYNTLVGKFNKENDLSGLIEKVTKLKEGPNEKIIWLHGGERNLRPEPGKTFNTIEELNKAWMQLINKLIMYLPEANKAAFSTKADEISNAINDGKYKGKDIDNSEKLKLMEKYNKMCDKMLNYTNSVLKRLEKEAKYEDPIEDDEEKSKGFFDKVKGKASKLVRKGKKVVAHKLDNSEKELDNSEKELDAAQKESKVEDEGTGRSVKQSVMDQPEYKTFKAVGQVIARKPVDFSSVLDKLKEGPSSAKSLRSKLKVMITDNNISKWKLENDKEFEAKVGVLYIGIAYLPSGSKGIEAACKGLSVGGIKGYNGTIGEAHKLMRAMKKGTRKGLEGHNLVKDPDVKAWLKYFVNEDSIPKIESKFSTLLKLKRKAAKLGSKAKETAKKAATKIGKSSVGRAAKSAATTAGGGIKSAARSVKKGILKRIKGSKSKKDSVKQETGVIDLEKPNNRKKSSFWVKEDE